MRKKKRQDQDDFVAKMKEQGIEVIDEAPTKNPFKRFGEWLYYIFRDIRHFFHERKMRKLKLGTVCWKDNELKTINISWDIHWMSNVYLAAIIRDYLRFLSGIRRQSVIMCMNTIPKATIIGKRLKS